MERSESWEVEAAIQGGCVLQTECVSPKFAFETLSPNVMALGVMAFGK